nr:putative capsid protein [Tombusviridae sp.]
MPGKTITKKVTVVKNAKSRTNRRGKKTNNKTIKMGVKVQPIPMAYSTKQRKPFYKITKSINNAQELVVTGEDLIVPAPKVVAKASGESEFFLTIPANPLYWLGTRLAGLAAVYQQYRPLKFDVEYIPQVPVTVEGQVIAGTLWNATVNTENIQQTLLSSNGGVMTQCYKPIHSHVQCNKKTLPLNLYNMRDDMNLNTTNPFTWVATYTGNSVASPGWVYVRWTYLLSVGMGQSTSQVYVYNQITTDTATNLDLAGWGVTFRYLFNLAKPLLRKVAIFVLKRVIAYLESDGAVAPTKGSEGEDSVWLNPGTILTYVGMSNDLVELRDESGASYFVSPDARIVVYTNGTAIQKPIPQPTGLSLEFYDFQFPSDAEYTVQYRQDEGYEVFLVSGKTVTVDVTFVFIVDTYELFQFGVNATSGVTSKASCTLKGRLIYNGELQQEINPILTGHDTVINIGCTNDSVELYKLLEADVNRTTHALTPKQVGYIQNEENILARYRTISRAFQAKEHGAPMFVPSMHMKITPRAKSVPHNQMTLKECIKDEKPEIELPT